MGPICFEIFQQESAQEKTSHVGYVGKVGECVGDLQLRDGRQDAERQVQVGQGHKEGLEGDEEDRTCRRRQS